MSLPHSSLLISLFNINIISVPPYVTNNLDKFTSTETSQPNLVRKYVLYLFSWFENLKQS